MASINLAHIFGRSRELAYVAISRFAHDEFFFGRCGEFAKLQGNRIHVTNEMKPVILLVCLGRCDGLLSDVRDELCYYGVCLFDDWIWGTPTLVPLTDCCAAYPIIQSSNHHLLRHLLTESLVIGLNEGFNTSFVEPS